MDCVRGHLHAVSSRGGQKNQRSHTASHNGSFHLRTLPQDPTSKCLPMEAKFSAYEFWGHRHSVHTTKRQGQTRGRMGAAQPLELPSSSAVVLPTPWCLGHHCPWVSLASTLACFLQLCWFSPARALVLKQRDSMRSAGPASPVSFVREHWVLPPPWLWLRREQGEGRFLPFLGS